MATLASPPPEKGLTAVHICSLSVEQLEELGPALFDFRRSEDLAAWLQAQAK